MPKDKMVQPATAYCFTDDLCILIPYFNPNGYRSKKKNYDRFIRPIRESGLHHVIVECSCSNNAYEIENAHNVVQVSSSAVLWQKERLLNIALSKVPPQCTKVVWIDSDILFSNEDWTKETSALLDVFPVVQPYERAIRLPKGHTSFRGEGLVYNSFGTIYRRYPNALIRGDFELHGHTGFVWAARKEVFREIGVYDACLSGVADHLMAHAFCGDWHSGCLRRMFLQNRIYFDHFEAWCKIIYERVKGRLTYSPGTILHLWHGNHAKRGYLENSQFLSNASFNPGTDLIVNETGCWEINSGRKEFAEWTSGYLTAREED